MNPKLLTITAGILLSLALPSFGQEPISSNDAIASPLANPLAANDQLINLKDSVALIQVMDFKYAPSQRDPFISHEIISPFVTEEELVEEIMEESEQQLPTRSEIEDLLRKHIRVRGVSTGNTGGGYALAYIPDENSEDGRAEKTLKPGKVINLSLQIDGADAAKYGEAFLLWNWLKTPGGQIKIRLMTTQIYEKHIDLAVGPNGEIKSTPRSEEAYPAVGFRVQPAEASKPQRSPFNEFYIPYIKEFPSLEE